MMDPRMLYELNPHVWEKLRGERPVLFHLLDGYIDAGMVGHNLRAHLFEQCQHEVLVQFDVDQLHDYRGRRPAMTFDTNRWVAASDFELTMHRLVSPNGMPFLMLAGPEPDFQWMRMTEAMLGLCAKLDVSTIVSAHGVPMQVPHTRPTQLISHVNRDGMVAEDGRFVERVDVPGSFSGYFEYKAGVEGRRIIGFSAQVPHYLTQSGFPQATLAVLQAINELTGLAIPEADLPGLSAENLAAINEQLPEAVELAAAIAEMERMYDAREADPRGGVPSADEIGAEFERFLAEQLGDDEQGG